MNQFRKFAIPYNGSSPKDFLKRLEPYKENVDHIFIGLSSFFDSYRKVEWGKKFVKSFDKKSKEEKEYFINDEIFQDGILQISPEEYDKNCLEFLEITKNGPYKRLLILNKMLWEISSEEIPIFVEKSVKVFVEYFNIQGILVGEFEMAKAIRECMPNIEIHLSICSKIKDFPTIRFWHRELNLSSVNLQPDFSRNQYQIEYIRKLGIKTKMLINESCICGCPMGISHGGYISGICPTKNVYKIYCDTVPLRNAFKGCFILPRHLKLFDNTVDIFKISTRRTETDRLFKMIDYYINERDDDTDIWKLVCGRMFRRLKLVNGDYPDFHLPINKIPDKVVLCDCMDCDNCDICQKVMEKFFKNSNISHLNRII